MYLAAEATPGVPGPASSGVPWAPPRIAFPAGVPTTATTMQPPVPVTVVDDPLNIFDAWSLGVSVVVGIVSLVLTGLALRIGRKANEAAVKAAQEAEVANLEASRARKAVASERRRAFELETLRDILRAFEVRVRISGGVVLSAGGGAGVPLRDREEPLGLRALLNREEGRVFLLAPDDLRTWNRLLNIAPTERWADLLAEVARQNTNDAYRLLYRDEVVVRDKLRKEVLAAMRIRVNARDD